MEVSFSDANLTTGRAVRNICVVALLIAIPLTAAAEQNRRGAERRAEGQRSEGQRSGGQRSERPSGDRRGDQRSADRSQADRSPADHPQNQHRQAEQRPSSGPGYTPFTLSSGLANRTPWWEQRQTPSWERPNSPNWASRKPPVPGYAEGNVARALLDQQYHRRPYNNYAGKYKNKPGLVYVIPPYAYGYGYPYALPYGYTVSGPGYDTAPPPDERVVTRPEPPEPPLPAMGLLRIEVEPRELLQIFVDGVFVGTPADLGDEIELTTGPKRIELRAPGYRTLIFDADVVAGRSITYRGALEPASAATPRPSPAPAPAPPVAAPAGSKTMYLIPGCYMGNVSPKEVALPPGCDVKKLTTISP